MMPGCLDLALLVRDYGDALAEARACREQCAVFDFSFMARARLYGNDAAPALERLQPRSIADLAPGRICYALRLDDAGAVVADLTIWNLGGGVYELMSGRRSDVADVETVAAAGTQVEDLSDATCVYAVQGPGALDAMAELTDATRLRDLAYFSHGEFDVAGVACRVGRLGYTGEQGFELIVPRSDAPRVWAQLTERAQPAGFAAADSLRIEAGFMLFANECVVRPTPAELGLARFAPVASRPLRMQLVCFKAKSDVVPIVWRPRATTLGVPRSGTIAITSAAHSTVAGTCLGLGFAHPRDVAAERHLEDPSGNFTAIELASLPYYDPGKRRPRSPWREPARGNSSH